MKGNVKVADSFGLSGRRQRHQYLQDKRVRGTIWPYYDGSKGTWPVATINRHMGQWNAILYDPLGSPSSNTLNKFEARDNQELRYERCYPYSPTKASCSTPEASLIQRLRLWYSSRTSCTLVAAASAIIPHTRPKACKCIRRIKH